MEGKLSLLLWTMKNKEEPILSVSGFSKVYSFPDEILRNLFYVYKALRNGFSTF